MNLTGYTITAAIRQRRLARDSQARNFERSIYAFPDDKSPPDPGQTFDRFDQAGDEMATLETLRERYNQQVDVVLPSGPGSNQRTTLSTAVRLLTHAERAESMWRQAASIPRLSPNSGRADDRVYPDRTIEPDICIQQAAELTRRSDALRAALATANATPVDSKKITDLPDDRLRELGLA